MEIKVFPNYVAITAETLEDAAKLSEAALLLRQQGRQVPLMAYRTIELFLDPLPTPKPKLPKSGK